MRRWARPGPAWVATVALVSLAAAPVWASPAPVRVRVTGDALDPKHAQAMEPRVHETAEALLRDEHAVAIADDATSVLAIELRPIVEAAEHDKVIFRVTVLADGEEVYGGQPTSCWGCDEAKLLASVRTQVAEAVQHLPEQEDVGPPVEAPPEVDDPAHEHAPAPAPAAKLEGAREGGNAHHESRSSPPPPLTLRNIGIGLVVGGGVLAAVGTGLAVANETVLEGDEERESVRRLRPSGVALAIVGGAALLGGVVALVVHGARATASKRTTWTPTAGAGHVGLVIEGRF